MTVCYWCGAKDTLADVGKELDDGKYKMVQCSKCKNAYYVVNKEKMNKQKPQTNEEWLWSATTEELAGTIYEWYSLGFTRGKNGKKLNSITEVVEWLKEEHNDSM